MEKLLKAGAGINAPAAEKYGRTALEGAAEYGRIDALQFLLDNGALIDGPGRASYDRAITYATRNGFCIASKILHLHHRRLHEDRAR